MDYFVQALRNNPELAIFLTLAIGFLIGRVKFGSFSLGIVVGTLLAGVLIGQLDIKVPAIVKTIFFDLFLFTTGYKVGPQFFRGLKGDALPQVALTVVLCVACLLTAFGFAKLLGYDVGTAAGLLAGAFSESTVIGTAGEAIQRLAIPDAEKTALVNNIPVAYAVTYLIGTASLVWFLPTIGPKLMGINLREEGARMQAAIAGAAEQELGVFSARESVRRPRVPRDQPGPGEQDRGGTRGAAAGRAGLHRADPPRGRDHRGHARHRHSQGRRRGGHRTAGGACAAGRPDRPRSGRQGVARHPDRNAGCRGHEPLAGRENRWRTWHGSRARAGSFCATSCAPGRRSPSPQVTLIDRGDVLSLIGTKPEVERAAKELGYADRATTSTDMVFVGTGIVLGGFVGLLSVTVAGIPLTLTASGGALIMGLVFGWLRSAYPFFGRIPEPAIWIFDTVGLCIFIGVVGLSAGPSFVAGLQKSGISLVFVGLVSALLPHTMGILFGRYVLRMEPLIVLGACAGAGTITAALRAIQDEAQSSIPALGYTVPYAIGNILLTAWGPVLVAMMSVGK